MAAERGGIDPMGDAAGVIPGALAAAGVEHDFAGAARDIDVGAAPVVQGDAIDITAHLAFETGSDASKHATVIRHFTNGPHLTDQMDSTGLHDYRFHLDDAEQTFSYMISSTAGVAEWYQTPSG